MRAIRVHEAGGPEKMRYEEATLAEPQGDQVRVRVHAIGVNFIDVYHRTGLYKIPTPFTPGMEAAGVVESVGENVTGVTPGDRVAYAMHMGSYAEQVLVPARVLVKIPASVDFRIAAAAMLQGMTAHYLTHSTFSLQKEQTALVHAAAGGAGLLIVQIAKLLGARVIGTVSTEAKVQRARAAGADHVIQYASSDFEAEVKKITDGRGVDVVYDSVGQTTFAKGLNCLRPRGMMVLFGQSSGPVPPLDPNVLNPKGSLFLTRPSLGHYAATPQELAWRAGDILGWIGAGKLKIHIDRTLPLSEASEAHRALESRATSGKLLLTP